MNGACKCATTIIDPEQMDEFALMVVDPEEIADLDADEWVKAVQACRRIMRHVTCVQDALFAHAMVGDYKSMDTLIEANHQMADQLDEICDILDDAEIEAVSPEGNIMSLPSRVYEACAGPGVSKAVARDEG